MPGILAIEADRQPELLERSRELSQGRRWRIFLAVLLIYFSLAGKLVTGAASRKVA